MATLQDLNTRRIDESLLEAAMRRVPATLTIRMGKAWCNYHSRVLALADNRLLMELPGPEEHSAPHEFVPAEKVGVSFKLKHHKHIFSAVLAGTVQFALDDGTTVPALAFVPPTRMQRLQRRAYLRADVPPNRIVRASFWTGGKESEPSGSPDCPVWSGHVVNISAGGFQLAAHTGAADGLEVGETVGVRLSFGAGRETVYADAQFRHLQEDNGEIQMGFQFLGLDQTDEGRQALRLISERVEEFQRSAYYNSKRDE